MPEDLRSPDRLIVQEKSTASSLGVLQNQLDLYQITNWDFYRRIRKTFQESGSLHPLLHDDEEFGDLEGDAKSRTDLVQAGLETLRKIGLDIISKGNIPLMRVLFLAPEEKEEFIQKYKGKSEFEPKDSQVNLNGYNLRDVINHVDAKAHASPFDSWTYFAPMADWFYGYESLGISTGTLILMTEKGRDQLIWTTHSLKGKWRFYKGFSDSRLIPEKSQIQVLNKDGYRGVLIPDGELDAVLWGNQPIKAIIDLSIKDQPLTES